MSGIAKGHTRKGVGLSREKEKRKKERLGLHSGGTQKKGDAAAREQENRRRNGCSRGCTQR